MMQPTFELHIENPKGQSMMLLSARKKYMAQGTYLAIQIGEFNEDIGRA